MGINQWLHSVFLQNEVIIIIADLITGVLLEVLVTVLTAIVFLQF